MVVDHHRTWDPDFADVYLRDERAAATGVLLFELAKRLGIMTPDIAMALYCCIVTDTGSFRYANTTAATLHIAAELIDTGLDPWMMTSHIYESHPKQRVALLGEVLNTLRVSPCGRLAFLRIDHSMLERHQASESLTDGFINYARGIDGVEVATLLRGGGGAEEEWRVSFRSRGAVDVSGLAAKFGGGGHHHAAGCSMTGTFDDVEDQLTRALEELLGA
jgi:phosphoesterase RecJ-like protein